LSRELLKLTVETALSAELTEHLGYEKHGDSRPAKGNARNGTTSQRLKSQHGDVEIETPRDRDGTFEPQLLRKNQTRLTQIDDQILTLYAKGFISPTVPVRLFLDKYLKSILTTFNSN
jgi:putative transposase